MRVAFLTGESVYLRAMVMEDKERAAAWFNSPFPINGTRAEDFLKSVHRRSWPPRPTYLAIARLADDEVVGSVRIASNDRRRVHLTMFMAVWVPDADALRAEALRLVVAWQRDELEMMTLLVGIAADQPATLAAAEALGMVQAVRLRQRLLRPGGRADELIYEARNPRWEVVDA